MGLDSYLYIKTNVFDDTAQQVATAAGLPAEIIKTKGSAILNYEVAYWRKFNALHNWFVNLSGRSDDCSDIELDVNHLIDLLAICKNIQAKPECAMQLLPTKAGFFYGSIQIDDIYMDHISYTIDRLELIINALEHNPFLSVYYASFW